MKFAKMGVAGVAVMLALACGSSEEPADESWRDEPTSGSESATSEPDDGSQITGLMGTIRRDQVENAMHPRMDSFQRCFSARMGQNELLGGDITLSFRIHTDGSVAWVYPSSSDIGDRETERCILEVAGRARFPRPRGGEAEFTWGFGLDPSPDVRPPLNWAADALGGRADDVPGIARGCGVRGELMVTAYIQPGGQVSAAGGTVSSADQLDALDCVLDRVRELEMPDPGSYAAKITFRVR